MLKNRSIIQVEVKGREFELSAAFESPLEDVKEALNLITSYVDKRIELMKAQSSGDVPVVEPEVIEG